MKRARAFLCFGVGLLFGIGLAAAPVHAQTVSQQTAPIRTAYAQPAGVPAVWLRPAYGDTSLKGPDQAVGAVVWSHGRSLEVEDSSAPTPLYLKALRNAGWDVYRFDRLRAGDTLPASSRTLAGHAMRLKTRGYHQVVLAGQSFGAFLSLLAAGQTADVDAVIATAPAAFGNFSESYESWRENASQLWPILRNVQSARVMMFLFHGDDFDPGGRAEPARTILGSRGLDHLVIDQPAGLTGHGAAASGLFVRRFGACIVRFAESGPRDGDAPCDATWGRQPSPDIVSVDGTPVSHLSGTATPAGIARPFLGRWYGTYVNGRELVLAVTKAEGSRVTADYILGPGVEDGQELEKVRRQGRIDGDELIFDESGRNVLRYRLRPDGRLAGSWLDKNGKGRLDTVLQRVD